MSGQKRLLNAIRTKRVVAIPTKKVERAVLDRDGNTLKNKDGVEQTETVQLYKIRPMR